VLCVGKLRQNYHLTLVEMSSSQRSPIKHLVLDAGPLLSLTPLKGIATNYYTVPQVVLELRDKNAREHFEKLALAGVDVQLLSPDVAAVARGKFSLHVNFIS
jgi:RNA-binding protein NOB1